MIMGRLLSDPGAFSCTLHGFLCGVPRAVDLTTVVEDEVGLVPSGLRPLAVSDSLRTEVRLRQGAGGRANFHRTSSESSTAFMLGILHHSNPALNTSLKVFYFLDLFHD